MRVCVCLRPRLLITSGVMWCDMNLIPLVVVIVNGRGLGIGTHCTH